MNPENETRGEADLPLDRSQSVATTKSAVSGWTKRMAKRCNGSLDA
jgi:hypothetical protein